MRAIVRSGGPIALWLRIAQQSLDHAPDADRVEPDAGLDRRDHAERERRQREREVVGVHVAYCDGELRRRGLGPYAADADP